MSVGECKSLTEPAGIHGHLGDFTAALETARRDLEGLLSDLTSPKLVWQPLSTVQSIGALLLHIACTETFWFGEELGAEEKKYLWDDSKDELPPSAPPMPLDWYLDRLRSARAHTLEKLSQTPLDRICERKDSDGKTVRYSLGWVLCRLLEHEAAHRGQIDMLKRWYREAHAPVYA